jgi:hypothetical protein
MYRSLEGKDNIEEKLQEYMEPLLYKYHVNVNLFAHIHSYERTCPVYKNKCIKDGVTQILIAMGGHDITHENYSHVDWSVYHDIDFGYIHIWLNKTQLQFNYHHTSDDKIDDHFILNK